MALTTGAAITVKAAPAVSVPQLLVLVYSMRVVPAVSGDTAPVAEIVATVVLVLLHVPPLPVVVKVVGTPIQAVAAPLIVPATGKGLTEMLRVVDAVPQLFTTV